ncbi:hypothetical protein CFOL_v3_11911 [Cephalotus follicularis]|uniref:Uncharacterized protein n=1 Tax=Cephalotus follicularis TaxID=3775 RepID=A0A1Q3BKG6_CEPFO|nr:hypothetical protein CFOL_v3_11911 [Cephalotus follicularis]
MLPQEASQIKTMEDSSPPTITNPKRPSLKSSSHFNNYPIWKDKLRENCYKRVREDRSRLLWKMRLPTAQEPHNHKDSIRCAFQDIVSDELKKIRDSSLSDHLDVITSAPEVIDMLWEYDGLHDAYQGECEEMLLEMQRMFYEDLRAEPTKEEPENQIETWEDDEDEYLARAVYEHMKLKDEQVNKKIWCPICTQGELLENHRLMYCSLCDLQLNKDTEVSLDVLRDRLAGAHAEHLDRGCRLKPKFCMETKFGLTALYVFCEVVYNKLVSELFFLF